MSQQKTGVIAAGLALFSMFFGAGNLIWPLILGGMTGDKSFPATLGILISGVSLPLLGLMAMMLFQGNYKAFFGQIGKIPGMVLITLIMLIFGPFGSLPRLVTLSFATLKPYFPEFVSLPLFSIAAAFGVFLLTLRKQRLIDLIGLILCPVLLLALGAILFRGFTSSASPEVFALSSRESFFTGLNIGYNTLDLVASFIFAPLVMSYFWHDEHDEDTTEARRHVLKKMVKASLIAAGLLAIMYIGMTRIAASQTPLLTPGHAPEERLNEISMLLLGPIGSFIACMAVALSCLTTAIPITVVCAEFLKSEGFRGKGHDAISIGLVLGLSAILANLGFMGIASMLAPILQIVCPGLIILSVLNIFHKLYEMRMRKIPVFAAFAISSAAYLIAHT